MWRKTLEEQNILDVEVTEMELVWRVERTESQKRDVSELERQEGAHPVPAMEEVMPINIETNVIFQMYRAHLAFFPKCEKWKDAFHYSLTPPPLDISH